MQTVQIIILCCLFAIVSVGLLVQQRKGIIEKYVNNLLSDFVSTGTFNQKELNTYAGNLMHFVPGRNYSADTNNILMFPEPTPTWISRYQVSIRQSCMDFINDFVKLPCTLFFFSEPNFQGRLVMVPFDPIPINQSLELSKVNIKNALLFSKYIYYDEGSTISCVVPSKYAIEIFFDDSNVPSVSLVNGPHNTVSCPKPIIKIAISPKEQDLSDANWQIINKT